jgi:hypothetical protein
MKFTKSDYVRAYRDGADQELTKREIDQIQRETHYDAEVQRIRKQRANTRPRAQQRPLDPSALKRWMASSSA